MPAELTVGFGQKVPGAHADGGYTPRPELLLRPEDLGPPLLSPMWWEGTRRWSGTGLGIPTWAAKVVPVVGLSRRRRRR
jgi:hypothetical protein